MNIFGSQNSYVLSWQWVVVQVYTYLKIEVVTDEIERAIVGEENNSWLSHVHHLVDEIKFHRKITK